jgi:hypothetical protein
MPAMIDDPRTLTLKAPKNELHTSVAKIALEARGLETWVNPPAPVAWDDDDDADDDDDVADDEDDLDLGDDDEEFVDDDDDDEDFDDDEEDDSED